MSTLTLPTSDPEPETSPQHTSTANTASSKPSQSGGASPEADDSFVPESTDTNSPSRSGPRSKQGYSLYPSIIQLLHEKGIPTSEAPKIPASGPKGRLLKGDVLAYIGRIASNYSSEQSARIAKLGHLDLRNVRAAVPKDMSASPKTSPKFPMAQDEEPTEVDVAIPISLSKVFAVQTKVQTALGVTLPLSTFLARATELANDGLPRSAASKLTADELFDDVLDLYQASSRIIRGHYTPQVVPIVKGSPSKDQAPPAQDLFDVLTGMTTPSTEKKSSEPPSGLSEDPGFENSTKLLRVSAMKQEQKTARVFLERMKTILQVEPGRLVL